MRGPTLGTPFPLASSAYLPLLLLPICGHHLTIYQALSGQSQQQTETYFAGKRYGELKRIVADLAIITLSPIQERYYVLMDDQTAGHRGS